MLNPNMSSPNAQNKYVHDYLVENAGTIAAPKFRTCVKCYDEAVAKWQTEHPGLTMTHYQVTTQLIGGVTAYYYVDGNDSLNFKCQTPIYTSNGYAEPQMMVFNHYTKQNEFLSLKDYEKVANLFNPADPNYCTYGKT